MEIKTALPSLWAVPDAIQTNLVAVEDAHPRCPRCTYFGEFVYDTLNLPKKSVRIP